MADDSTNDVTLTVVDEIVTEDNAQEPMEVDAEKAKAADADKKSKKRKEEEEEDEDDENAEEIEEEDPEKREELRVNPRLHLVAGPLLFRDLHNLKEVRSVISQSDHFDLRFFRVSGTKVRSKRGYVKFSFKLAEVAYWVLDNLRNLKVPRTKVSVLNCWMFNKETAHDVLHKSGDKTSFIKKKLEEIGEQDISQRALYFGSLPKTVTLEKMQEYVPEAKEIFLPVVKGNPRGYAFIEFESKEQAEEALTTYKSKKLDEATIVVRKIGSGKTARFLVSRDTGRTPRGGMGRPRGSTRGGPMRRRSPPRGPPRRYQGPIWDTWGRDGDRKRRMVGDDRPYGRRDNFRRDRIDEWERELRRDIRDKMLTDMRYGDYNRDYMGRGYDRGFGDPWVSSSSFSRPGY